MLRSGLERGAGCVSRASKLAMYNLRSQSNHGPGGMCYVLLRHARRQLIHQRLELGLIDRSLLNREGNDL